jgi:hypothetical protein
MLPRASCALPPARHPHISKEASMVHLKLFCMALIATFAYGVLTTSASALELPDVSIALSEAYPLHLDVTYLTTSDIENISSEGLESKESNGGSVLLLLLVNTLTTLGTYSLLFTKIHLVKEGKEESICSSEGDPTTNGEVLEGGTFHIVFRSTSPLSRGILFLEREIKVTCGTVKIKIKGSMLARLEQPSGTEETTLLLTSITGSAGKPTNTAYLNDSGETEHAELLSNFGTGFVELALNIVKPADLHALEGKMFTISPF